MKNYFKKIISTFIPIIPFVTNAVRKESSVGKHYLLLQISKLGSILLLLGFVFSLSGCSNSGKYKSCSVPEDLMAKYQDSETLSTDFSDRINEVLAQAKDNKSELTTVLKHYADQGDFLKCKAAEFLIANMGTHYYGRVHYEDSEGNPVSYNSLDYETYDEALEAWDTLEARYPELKTKVDKEWDAEVISAGYLISDIDLAFSVWESRPWAKDVTFDTFCNYILPYRGSNEPVDRWRERCIDGAKPQLADVKDLTDKQALRKAFSRTKSKWVKFKTKVYLHPTDQGFEEMLKSGVGRCEDLSNMLIYINRANGLPTTSDFTPAWPKGDNNHAWEMILDGNGKPLKKPRFGIVAKIYRKMFAEQHDLPYFNKKEGEVLPHYLKGATYLDVTSQYLDNAIPVNISITEPIPDACSWAYLSVFNSGSWVPIVAGRIDNATKQVTFPDVGRDIMYRPVFCIQDKEEERKLVSAAPVIIVEKDGYVRVLDKEIEKDGTKISVTIIQTKDVQINPDTGKPEKTLKVEPDKEYELFYFDKQWVSLGKKTSTEKALSFDNLPPERLYRLRYLKGRDNERPFTVDNGKQVLW